MFLFTGGEFDVAFGGEDFVVDVEFLIVDFFIVYARAAAFDEAFGFAFGFSEAAFDEEIEDVDAVFKT